MSNTIRELLGVTQEEMALLLQVSRSQFSLYELGKRDLPVAALLKMAEMLTHVQNTKLETSEPSYNIKTQSQEKKKIVNELLFINKRKQLSLNKNIKAFEKKQKNNEAALKLVDYLKTSTSSEKKDLLLIKVIETKITLKCNPLEEKLLFENQIKKELLEKEAQFLEEFLKKIG